LLVADSVLEFEARLGKFTVRPHPEGAKLRHELDMLDIEEQPIITEQKVKDSLTEAGDDPWENYCVEGILKMLAHSISSQGYYDHSLEKKDIRASAKPVIEFAPALILRKRSLKGLTETLKQIKERIEGDEDIPDGFAGMAEIRVKNGLKTYDGTEKRGSSSYDEIFFPKPTNDEQRSIVDKIRVASGVLVQGPPGTGKSHTIANLICHLLATGQRTLITAKTPRALQVLEGLVPEELRPLCISLLGNGIDERRSLESSVGSILRKKEEWRQERSNQNRMELEERLRAMNEEKVKIDRRIRDIRESETYSHSVVAGRYFGTAARIAEAVNRDRIAFEWFKDTAPLDKNCPISSNDLLNLILELRQFTSEKRRELELVWPSELPSYESFVNLINNKKCVDEEARKAISGASESLVNLLENCDSAAIEEIYSLLCGFREIRRKSESMHFMWMSYAIRDILGGKSFLWRELLRLTQDTISSVERFVSIADDARIEFPVTIDLKTLHADACTLKEHMENGGKLGWWFFRPKLVKERLYIINSVMINGHTCNSTEDLSKLVDALHVRIECEKAWFFWIGRSEKTQGPYAFQLIALKSMCEGIEIALSLEDIMCKCREAIKKRTSMNEPIWTNASQLETIISSCCLALARNRKRNITEAIKCIETTIFNITSNKNAHPVTLDLLEAIRNGDTHRFALCENTIRNLKKQHQRIYGINEQLSKLRLLLPQLINSLEQTCNESYWEKRVQSIDDAWHWAQAYYWLNDYIRYEDVTALAKRAEQINNEINDIIAKLASLHAWSFCFSRLKEDHQRHMEAWQQSMRRLGKGTGKHAIRHRREAQRHLNECREAVPAWIMPLHRIWDTVSPAPGIFDVILVDEASQCGIEALPLFYLSKKILIVGDDKQISPEVLGLPRDKVHHLIDELLFDYQFKSSFDVESSLFDHGKLRYGAHRVTLREHFRCMPEIIRFSNDLCYSDTPLIPLRQYSPNRLPPLEHVFVSSGYREGSNNRTINRPEAKAIVDRIFGMCHDNRYNDKSFGVVVLQGEAQASLIENQLLERLGADEMQRRRLVCGNPYSFQGDERDIMFLSLVAATNERIGPLTKSTDERRFNVATSRARDMMILFHSVNCDDLSSTCLRHRLLQFFENSTPRSISGIKQDELEKKAYFDNRGVVSPPAPFDSWFEVDVALELLRKGFTVLAQHEVAGKFIDLVVEDGQARLAVECDGDKWHGVDRYEADMARQRQLERCGWEFFRVRESTFYANKEKALTGLWRKLEERSILPI
jgi:very-short-patch-repair endonuclease